VVQFKSVFSANPRFHYAQSWQNTPLTGKIRDSQRGRIFLPIAAHRTVVGVAQRVLFFASFSRI
jgi:hypothetical protein